MNQTLSTLIDEYRSAFHEHLERPGEKTLVKAYELGRKALNQRLGTPDLAAAYREILAEIMQSASGTNHAIALAEAAAQFFSESLSPFEITYRSFHQAHEALRASEERFRDLFENASDIIFTLDLRGNITSWNRRAEEITGYRLGEVSPLNIAQILAPEHAELTPKMLEQMMTSAGRTTYEAEIFAKDGRRLTIEVSSRLLYQEGQTTGVQGIARDVTERKRAERQFQDLLEAAPDAMVVVNDQGSIAFVNAEVQNVFGYEPKELLGQPVEILMPTRFREHHRSHRAQFVASPRRRPMGAGLSLFGLRKDGTEFPIDVSLGPVDTEDGVLVISSVRDITDRKKAQEALQRMNVALEQEARRIAHALHDESGQLLASVHMVIDAMAEGAPGRTRRKIEDVKKLLDEIEVKLRQFSHELRPTILDDLGLTPALQFLAQGVSGRAKIPVAVDCRIGRRLPSPIETAVYRVVQEALTNVVRHAEASHAYVRVEEREGTIRGSIRDDGKGLDPRAVLSHKGRAGLGLIGMRARLSPIGGKITIRSQPGQGTEIQFTIREEDSSHVDKNRVG